MMNVKMQNARENAGKEESEVNDKEAMTYAQVIAHWGVDGHLQEAHPMVNIGSSVSLSEASPNRQAPMSDQDIYTILQGRWDPTLRLLTSRNQLVFQIPHGRSPHPVALCTLDPRLQKLAYLLLVQRLAVMDSDGGFDSQFHPISAFTALHLDLESGFNLRPHGSQQDDRSHSHNLVRHDYGLCYVADAQSRCLGGCRACFVPAGADEGKEILGLGP